MPYKISSFVFILLCFIASSIKAQSNKESIIIYAYEQQIHSGVNPSTMGEAIEGNSKNEEKSTTSNSIQYRIYVEYKTPTIFDITEIWIHQKAYGVKKERVKVPVIITKSFNQEGHSTLDTLVKHTFNKVYYLNLINSTGSFPLKETENTIRKNDVIIVYRQKNNAIKYSALKKIRILTGQCHY